MSTMGDVELNPIYEALPVHREPPEGKADDSDHSDKRRSVNGYAKESPQKMSSKKQKSRHGDSKGWPQWRLAYTGGNGRDSPQKRDSSSRSRKRSSPKVNVTHSPNDISFRSDLPFDENYFISFGPPRAMSLDRRHLWGSKRMTPLEPLPENGVLSKAHDDVYSYFNPNNRIRLFRNDAYGQGLFRSRSALIPTGSHYGSLNSVASAPPSVRRVNSFLPAQRVPLRTISISKLPTSNGEVVYASKVTVPVIPVGRTTKTVRARHAPIPVGNGFIKKSVVYKQPEPRKPKKSILKSGKLTASSKSVNIGFQGDKPTASYSFISLSIPGYAVENMLARETETITVCCMIFDEDDGDEVIEDEEKSSENASVIEDEVDAS